MTPRDVAFLLAGTFLGAVAAVCALLWVWPSEARVGDGAWRDREAVETA